jgi:hypothetical protein
MTNALASDKMALWYALAFFVLNALIPLLSLGGDRVEFRANKTIYDIYEGSKLEEVFKQTPFIAGSLSGFNFKVQLSNQEFGEAFLKNRIRNFLMNLFIPIVICFAFFTQKSEAEKNYSKLKNYLLLGLLFSISSLIFIFLDRYVLFNFTFAQVIQKIPFIDIVDPDYLLLRTNICLLAGLACVTLYFRARTLEKESGVSNA